MYLLGTLCAPAQRPAHNRGMPPPQTLRRFLCLVAACVQRLARPWDSPEAELTFKPRISARSQQLIAEARGNEGGGGFLDRLKSDLRRREAKQKVRRQLCVLCCMGLAHATCRQRG